MQSAITITKLFLGRNNFSICTAAYKLRCDRLSLHPYVSSDPVLNEADKIVDVDKIVKAFFGISMLS